MTTETTSKFLRHEGCPKCLSKNNLARYDDGHAVCFGCKYYEFAVENTSASRSGTSAEWDTRRIEVTGVIAAIPDRKLSESVCKKFGVTVEYGPDGTISKHHYPFKDKDTGDTKAIKTRVVAGKQFFVIGTSDNLGLFGQSACAGRGKFLTITEGEIDAMAVSEMFDLKWDVVSLRQGANSAAKEIKENLQWLEGYDSVVLCFDSDKAGRLAVDAVKDLFSPNKVKIMKLPLKDAGEMLEKNQIGLFTKAFWDAKVHRPDGIMAGVDTWDRIITKRKVKSLPYPWDGLNQLTRGMRLGELVTLTSGSGMGKSQMVRELEHYFLRATETNIGVVALEEDVASSALGLMSIEANRPLHLEENVEDSVLRPYWEKTFGTNRFFLFDHFGSTASDNLLNKIRYMVKALDCQWIVLDHLSIVVSSQEDGGDERKNIDSIMTKLRTLVQELGIGLFLISHLKRASSGSHEEGGRISLSELRGSQAIAQLSDMVIGLERNQQHEDAMIRNTSLVRVLKNRYSGLTGPACYLFYDIKTGRMVEVLEPLEGNKDRGGENDGF